MRKHNGIAEILATGQCPGIVVSAPSRDSSWRKPPGYDRASDTYYDRVARRRLPCHGKARERALKEMGQVDLRDFKGDLQAVEKFLDGSKQPEKPIPKERILRELQKTKQEIAPGKSWKEMADMKVDLTKLPEYRRRKLSQPQPVGTSPDL